ncbi:MAG TPA: GntR family transcriptional regulator [Longimicrobiaceae bacterium]|nr:GntR family transcriptional regulator [Longimicrobiaceae bacterium]
MKLLDPASPIPLYAQLAEAIRYEIATGAIAPGEMLPALRLAARRWGVNLHTVRRAYGSLAEKGVVRTDPQVGTVVLGRPAASPAVDPVDWFVSRIVTEAYERHGLSVEELKLRLDRWGSRGGMTTDRPVYVIERTEGEAGALASQLRGRWSVGAEGWSLERPAAPPAGTLLAPLQHYSEIRLRWPERVGEVHFLRTAPEPAVVARVLTSSRPTIRAVLCEREIALATSVVADLRRILPSGRVDVMPHVVSRAGELLSFVPDSLDAVLFPPRMWESLSAAERANPKAVPVRYVFDARETERLAEDLGWGERE